MTENPTSVKLAVPKFQVGNRISPTKCQRTSTIPNSVKKSATEWLKFCPVPCNNTRTTLPLHKVETASNDQMLSVRVCLKARQSACPYAKAEW